MSTLRATWYSLGWVMAISLVMIALPAFAAAVPAVKCSDFVGLTNKIAGCIRASLDNGVHTYFSQFYPIVKKSIGVMMTFAVIVYGIMLAYGMVEKVGRDTFILLFKLAGVIYFTTSADFIYSSAIKSMDSAALAVISYAPQHGNADTSGTDFNRSVCLQTMIEEQQKVSSTTKMAGPWLGMDCLIDSVIGIKLPDSTTSDGVYFNKLINGDKDGMSRGLLYLFFSGLQTSSVGIALAVLGAVFLWGLIALIIKTLFIYVAGYMGVAFTTIISPLFIPMILFQHTRQYFDKWLKSFFSFALQPVIMMAFITFSIVSVDFAAFSGDYSIWYRIAGEQARSSSGFNLNAYLTQYRTESGAADTASPPAETSKRIIDQPDKKLFEVKLTNPDPNATVATTTTKGGLFGSLTSSKDCTPEMIKQYPDSAKACNTKRNVTAKINSINWIMMAKARTNPPVDGATDVEKGKQIAEEVMASIAFCALVVFLMNGFLKLVPLVAYDITGEYLQSAKLTHAVAGQWKDRNVLSGAFSEINNSIKKAMGSR